MLLAVNDGSFGKNENSYERMLLYMYMSGGSGGCARIAFLSIWIESISIGVEWMKIYRWV